MLCPELRHIWGHTAREWLHETLSYLVEAEGEERLAVYRDARCLARGVIGCRGDPDPYRTAWEEFVRIKHRPPARALVAEFDRPDVPTRDPAPTQVDGRTGAEWVQSIFLYYEWRIRRCRERFHPERLSYLEARRVVYEAFYLWPEPPRPRAEALSKKDGTTRCA